MKNLTELSNELHKQRTALSMSQKDMLMKIGMSQQQYQRAESGGDLRVSSLMRILEGMGLELMLVPRDRIQQVKQVLASPLDWHDNPVEAGSIEHITQQKIWDSELSDLDDDQP